MSENIPTNPKDVEGASARIRTQSECSIGSNDGNPSVIGKRQRTTSQTFMVTSGLTSASPPKFVSLEEIMQAANGIKDMALVHQIVVDKNFRLEPFEPEPNSIHKVIKDNMHKAFWDLLRNDFALNPPVYTNALVLLDDVRQGLFDLLLPQHTKLKQQISEILDRDLIRQQTEKGILDFNHYAQYVISVMGKLCAPVRDDKIKELTETTDIVDTFRGILETLNLMMLDMANFTIEISKPDIIAHSVELERMKFADFLAIQPDGLEFTRKWLLKYLDPSISVPANVDRTEFVRAINKDCVIRACIDLLEWDMNEPYPETFMLDESRLAELQLRMDRLVIIGTILLITISNVGSDLSTLTSFKIAIKEHASIIMQSYNSQKDLAELLSNVSEQVTKDIKDARKEHNFAAFTESQEHILRDLIADVSSPDNKIKQLVRQRVKEFFQQIIASSTAAPQKVPSGLTALQRELTEVAGQFLKIVSHNGTVFCNYYFDIINAAIPTSG